MIRAEENDGIIAHAGGLEYRHQFADLVVEIGNIGEIAAPRSSHIVLGNIELAVIIGQVKTLRMGVLFIKGDRPDLWFQMGAIFIKVPIFAPRNVGVMGMGKGDRQTPGPGLVFIGLTGELIEFLGGVEGHLIIIFHLVGGLRNAGTRHRTQIVIPPVNAFTGFAIIRRPAKIRRIDIGRQPLLEAVQLIRPDKMHLARQACVIAVPAQMMGIGWNVGAEFGGIVEDAGAAWQLPGHEGGAAGGTER